MKRLLAALALALTLLAAQPAHVSAPRQNGGIYVLPRPIDL